ncbi:MAG: hypothetical protein M0P43_01830 [Arcobacteraceae bacterium]|nr:hypothetical protein [Arcobacteraceae bacterium]
MPIPTNSTEVNVVGATVPFFKETIDGIDIYYFDTSATEPPVPMINAMAGLNLVTKTSKLIMINHKMPTKLLENLENTYKITKETLTNGNAKVTFETKI